VVSPEFIAIVFRLVDLLIRFRNALRSKDHEQRLQMPVHVSGVDLVSGYIQVFWIVRNRFEGVSR
jgi:hypothetical protein